MPVTLLERGKLTSTTQDPAEQRELDRWVPYEYIIRWFRDREARTGVENRFLVIKAKTSSGKSTLLPPEIFRHLVMQHGPGAPGIVCTQPRVLTAIKNVSQIVYHSGPDYPTFLKIGETIGWSTKFSKLKPKNFGLLSATIGTVLMQLQTQTDAEIMALYKYILIDEVHTRDLSTDTTLNVLKCLLNRQAQNPLCPFVVLMSATIEFAPYLEYFGGTLRDNAILCEGISFPRPVIWDYMGNSVTTDYAMKAADCVVHIIEKYAAEDKPEESDILVFLPSRTEFAKTMRKILEYREAKLVPVFAGKLPIDSPEAQQGAFVVLQIDSEAQRQENDDYMSLDKPLEVMSIHSAVKAAVVRVITPIRRVILTTNVAETGLTLNGLKYVVDSGYDRASEYNPLNKINVVISRPASLPQLVQRYGRAGRKRPGFVYPLYSEETSNMLAKESYPQIMTQNITPVLMQIMLEQQRMKESVGVKSPYFSVGDMDLVDLPVPDLLLDGLERLYALGLISPEAPPFNPDAETFISAPRSGPLDSAGAGSHLGLTRLGRLAVAVGTVFTAENFRMVMAGFAWEYSPLDLIAVAAYTMLGSSKLTEREEAGTDKLNLRLDILYNDVIGADPADLWHWRLLTGDTFMDGIILSRAVDRMLADADPSTALPKFTEWCNQRSIAIGTLLEYVNLREDMITALLAQGIDIYAFPGMLDHHGDAADTMNMIVRYKHCVHEGYRLNLIEYDDEAGEYRTQTGMKVSSIEMNMPALAKETRPRYVLYDQLMSIFDFDTGIYNAEAANVSILDGYIANDSLFTQ